MKWLITYGAVLIAWAIEGPAFAFAVWICALVATGQLRFNDDNAEEAPPPTRAVEDWKLDQW